MMEFPGEFSITFVKKQPCRYGENPQQDAVIYETSLIKGLEMVLDKTLMSAKQYQGKEMSFNNFLDADANIKLIREFEGKKACSITKHANPSGAAIREKPLDAFKAAWSCDSLSSFGGIVCLNSEIDGAIAAEIIAGKFVEAVLAPGYTSEALESFKKKTDLRILELNTSRPEHVEYDFRFITGGVLVQEFDRTELTKEMLTYPNDLVPDLGFEIDKPTDSQIDDMLFGWKVNRNTKSNTVLLVKDMTTIGIGAGQQNRVDAGFIACYRGNKPYAKLTNQNREIDDLSKLLDANKTQEVISALPAHLAEYVTQILNKVTDLNELHNLAQIVGLQAKGRSEGSVAVSSAFYPFPDTINVLHACGVVASMSPSGSIRDKLSYEAMHKHKIAAVHTPIVKKGGYEGGMRAFKH